MSQASISIVLLSKDFYDDRIVQRFLEAAFNYGFKLGGTKMNLYLEILLPYKDSAKYANMSLWYCNLNVWSRSSVHLICPFSLGAFSS